MEYLTFENAMYAILIASAALPVLEKLASYTKTTWDDELVHKAMDFVSFVTSYIPRLRFGAKK